jgi:hypothetical protein
MPSIISQNPRKLAPKVEMVSEPFVDERARLVAKVKKQLGARAEGMHFFFGDRNIAESGRYEDEGYIAVEGVKHLGDPLFMRPDKEHKAHLERAAIDSQVSYQASKNGENDEYRTQAADGTVYGPVPDKDK